MKKKTIHILFLLVIILCSCIHTAHAQNMGSESPDAADTVVDAKNPLQDVSVTGYPSGEGDLGSGSGGSVNGGSTGTNTGSGGGGGTSNSGDNPTPPTPSKQDPCAKAKALAEKIKAALSDPEVKAHLDEFIEEYKNSNLEHGFAIIKNTDGTYSFTATDEGTDNHVNIDIPADADVVALVHTHPPEKSAVPSPTDIYGLNEHLNADFAGNIVISGDDRYMVSITDADKYSAFVSKKDKYYDTTTQSQWKYKSAIDNKFRSFLNNYLQMYSGQDAVFPTQLFLMNDFNMGVSLQKWDGSDFNPISANVQYDTSAGSSTTIGGGGQTINSPYSSITVDPACH